MLRLIVALRIDRFQRGLKRKPLALIKKLRKAKREAATGEKPEPVRTHLRNMIIVPEMIGSVIGVYNGKTFNQVTQRCNFHLFGSCICRLASPACVFSSDGCTHSKHHADQRCRPYTCIQDCSVLAWQGRLYMVRENRGLNGRVHTA